MITDNDYIPQEITERILDRYQYIKGWEDRGGHSISVIQRRAAEWGAFQLDKWISVKDRLPEEIVDVLVYLERTNNIDMHYITVADYYEGKWGNAHSEDLNNNIDFYVITHWMPLPKKPYKQ